jgi:hypothetical protein
VVIRNTVFDRCNGGHTVLQLTVPKAHSTKFLYKLKVPALPQFCTLFNYTSPNQYHFLI